MEGRIDRQARNEEMFRAVNREIEQASEQLGDRDLEVLCECGSDGCKGLIAVTAEVYDGIHAQADRFLVLPGHESPELENVVERTERYFVVDKYGRAEDIVEG